MRVEINFKEGGNIWPTLYILQQSDENVRKNPLITLYYVKIVAFSYRISGGKICQEQTLSATHKSGDMI